MSKYVPNHKYVVLEVRQVGTLWQSELKAKLFTVIFTPSLTRAGAIIAANNYIRTHKMIPANRNKVSKNFYDVERLQECQT